MSQNEWRKYIKMAKDRMREMSLVNKSIESDIYLDTEIVSAEDLKKFNRIVKEVVASSDFIYNPIGMMINQKKYDEMTEEKRNKYVMDLSEIYLTLRKKI